MENNFFSQHASKIKGVIGCYDRLIINGNLQKWSYSKGIMLDLWGRKIPIKEYTNFAEELKIKLEKNIGDIANKNAIKIDYISSPKLVNKEARIQEILRLRGDHNGIVHIFSVIEPCMRYRALKDIAKDYLVLKQRSGICLHYYIYFIDANYGLCFFRIPTWLPFRVQFYCNGHNYLANQMKKAKVGFTQEDNAFTHIDDFQTAQKLSDNIRGESLIKYLHGLSKIYIPFLEEIQQEYYWTIDQAEYSTDVIFRKAEELQDVYDDLTRTIIHAIKPGNIATFFSRKLAAAYKGEVTTKYNILIHGTRIKHRFGANNIKIYNKGPVVLRVETTVNKLSEVIVIRDVQTRKGPTVKKRVRLKKNVNSLFGLRKFCWESNNRYLDFISYFNNTSDGRKNLKSVSKPTRQNNRSYRGFNFFDEADMEILW